MLRQGDVMLHTVLAKSFNKKMVSNGDIKLLIDIDCTYTVLSVAGITTRYGLDTDVNMYFGKGTRRGLEISMVTSRNPSK